MRIIEKIIEAIERFEVKKQDLVLRLGAQAWNDLISDIETLLGERLALAWHQWGGLTTFHGVKTELLENMPFPAFWEITMKSPQKPHFIEKTVRLSSLPVEGMFSIGAGGRLIYYADENHSPAVVLTSSGSVLVVTNRDI